MTIPRINKIFEHWGTLPPVHLSMAALAGVDTEKAIGKSGTPAAEASEQDVAQFMSMFPKRGG